MSLSRTRRSFLRLTAGAAAVTGLSDWGILGRLPSVTAAEAQVPLAGMAADVEPLVRLLEETPREKLLEEVAQRIRRGTSYREVVASLLLAGVRNIQPRPNVGFKFHAVLVVNSAHLASLASLDEHRWLPIFWAIDYFKDAQAQNAKEGNWKLPPVDESRVPASHQAREMFVQAMDRWDEGPADAAVTALARHAGSAELFEIFCRYGARDFRAIGHKAIFVANAWRTLQCIGWRYAEPVLRSLTYAILNHHGEANPAENDFAADRPFRDNLVRVQTLQATWRDGAVDSKATADLLTTFYAGSASDVCGQAVELLNRGVSPQSLWDAILSEGGELLMRQPGIVGLHTLTTANAFRYAYGAAASEETRQLMLLQAAAFLPMFRDAMHNRGAVASTRIGELEPESGATDDETLTRVFALINQDRAQAARLALAYAQAHPDPSSFISQARLLVFLKGRDSHDYKFSSAVLEDYYHLSPPWRARFLASSVYHLRGSGSDNNPLVERIRHSLTG